MSWRSSSSSSSSSRSHFLGLEKERRRDQARWPGLCQGPEILHQPRQWHKAAHKEPLVCHDVVVQNALYTGNLAEVQRHFSEHAEVNLIIEAKSHEPRWTSHKWGVWALSYAQELTTPLHVTAGRGFLDCLRHLLLRGADVDLAPGGRSALHEACAAAATDCARLLLAFGADANAASEAGLRPLHLCQDPASLECARLLLRRGADVNAAAEAEAGAETPLHVAARLGLPEHVGLFLCHGASLEAANAQGQTPLNAACAQLHPPHAGERYYEVCRQLVEAGARVEATDRDLQRPLHQACRTANARVVALLLARGASANAVSYSGTTALVSLLQGAPCRLDHRPELAVRELLNHGAARVWPGALLKVLRHCCASPRTLEALINTYERVPVTEEWTEVVPEELVQRYPRFFQSLFSLGRSPRALLHLARCALRSHLEGRRLLQALPELHLPPALLRFLLLSFEDVLY